MNWTHLSSLCLESHGSSKLTPFTALEIISKCLSLIDCRLEFTAEQFGHSPASVTHGSVVTLPLLRTLAIKEGGDATGMVQFYDHVHLPSLVNIEFIRFIVEDSGLPANPSRALFLSRIDMLQEISVPSFNVSEEILLGILES